MSELDDKAASTRDRMSAERKATETLTLRVSAEDRALLDQLVELQAKDLVVEGVRVTAASYVRGLIRREAQTKGFIK